MKKRLTILLITLTAIVLVFCVAGCDLMGNNTDTLATNTAGTNSASSSVKTKVTYSDMTKDELAEEVTTLRELLAEYKQLVADLVSGKEGIGALSSVLVDSVMNLTCVESQYNVGCQGTGFIITGDGYVLTNNHVVEYTTQVIDGIRNNGWFSQYTYKTVTGVYSSITACFDEDSSYYANGAVYNLKFVYRDPDYDLALLKLEEAAPVGDSWSAIPFYGDDVKRGDELLVLGNADGFGLSATSGIVSATGKSFTDSPKLTFIQTDAAINGGNSGGPAVNAYGALIGVVNSKFVSTNIENMGFAIELDKVKTFIADAEADATEKGSSIKVSYTTKIAAATPTEEALPQAA